MCTLSWFGIQSKPGKKFKGMVSFISFLPYQFLEQPQIAAVPEVCLLGITTVKMK